MLRSPVVRRLAHRSYNWHGLVSKMKTDAARNEAARLKGIADQIMEKHAKFGSVPDPIDFDAYKEKVSSPIFKEIIAKQEAAYNQYINSLQSELDSAATVSPDVLEAISEAEKQALESAAAFLAETSSKLEDLEGKISGLKAHRTSRDTTLEEIFERYPEMEKEIDEEIDNHDWAKDAQ